MLISLPVVINDYPGRDEQEKATDVEDLIAKMSKPLRLKDGTR